MAATPGKTGGLFYRKAWIQGTTLAFVDSNPDTITDSGNGFVTAGFEAGDLITVSGASNGGNNTNFTIEAGGVAAGTLTLIAGDAVTVEGASANITIQEALPGTQVLGFSGWAFDETVDMLDVTRFEDVGIERMIAGLKRWTGSATKFFETSELTAESWVGSELLIRFFYRYDASPNAITAWYLEGNCFANGVSAAAPVDGVVTSDISFTGSAKASINATTLAFVDSNPDTITDSGNGFITAGFEAGDKIKVSGATNAGNNTTFTVTVVTAGVMTLTLTDDVLTAESAGAAVSIVAEVRLTTRTIAWPT